MVPHQPIGLQPVLAGKYRMQRHLGSGGMGSVHEVEHVLMGKLFALKLLRGAPDGDEKLRRRFEREARALARLDHENIVSLLEIGHDPVFGNYLVLEYIRGRTLRQELANTEIRRLARVSDIFRQVARGLSHAHEAGVIHRDLKPENIMLTAHADGSLLVKLLDFGVARLLDGDGEKLTATDVGVGTAAYMAPEQARGERNLDARTDVYAMGANLYECLTGLRPYEGKSYNETIFLILNARHRELSALRPDLPRGVHDAVEKALAKSPDRRFASVDELIRALLESCPPSAGADDALTLTRDSASHAPIAAGASCELEARLARRERWLGAMLGLGAGVLAMAQLWPVQPRILQHARFSWRVAASPTPCAVVATSEAVTPGPEASVPAPGARSSPAALNPPPGAPSTKRAERPRSIGATTQPTVPAPSQSLAERGYQLESPYADLPSPRDAR